MLHFEEAAQVRQLIQSFSVAPFVLHRDAGAEKPSKYELI